MNYHLTELFDIEELRELCESYTEINGTTTAILDLEGNIYVACGWQPSCTQFHRINQNTSIRCKESDTNLAGQIKEGNKYNFYKCKNGLNDIAMPIIVGDRHVGNFFTGQFLTEEPDIEYFRKQANEFGFDEKTYLEAINNVPIFTEVQIKKSITFLVKLVETIGNIGIKNIQILEKAGELEKTKETTEINNRINEARLNLIQFSENHTIDEILEETLNIAEIISESKVGFFHFIEEGQMNIELQNWSTATKKNYCNAQGKSSHYPIDKTGAWVDCFYERKPVINNNYNALTHKKGLPEHPSLIRELTIPIIYNDNVKAIFGVGNKETDYTENDIENISLLAYLAMEIIEKKKINDTLFIAKERAEEREFLLLESQKIARVGSYVLDINTGTWTSSETLNELFGIDNDYDKSIEGWLKIVHPADREIMKNYLNDNVIAKGENFEKEYRIIRINDRRERWVKGFGKIRYNKQGKLVGMIGVIQDITKRKKNENKILENEKRYTSLFNEMINGFAYHKIICDEQGSPCNYIFLSANPAFERLTGLKAKDIIGKSIYEIIPENDKYWVEIYGKVALTGESIKFQNYASALNKHFSVTAYCPEIGYFATIFEDVTEKINYERELQLLNKDFVTFLENTQDFIYYKDKESRFRFCSQTLANITFHKSWRDMIGKHDLEVFPPDAAKIYYEEELPIFEYGKSLINKIDPYYKSDGSKGYVSTSKWPVWNDDKSEVVGIFGISRDITERVEIEEALKESELRAKTMINAIPDLVFRLDKDGRYLDYKADTKDLYAQSAPSIIGVLNRDITPPEFADLIDEKISLTLTTGILQTFDFQMFIQGKGLREFEARMVKSGEDETTSIVRDVTDIKKAETELKESEQKFRQLFEFIPIPLGYSNNKTMKIELVNKAFTKILEYNYSDIPNLDDWFLKAYPDEKYREEVSETWKKLVIDAIKNNVAVEPQEYNITTKSGRKMIFEVSGISIGDFFLSTFFDLTSRKKMESQLRETNQNLEEMVYIASHDLQVPIISMESFASILLKDYSDNLDEKGKFALTRLLANAENMHKLILSLLDISRLNTKKNPYEKFDLNSVIEKILTDLSLVIEKNNAQITLEKLPELFADKQRIEIVFRNLISNAINYEGKKITIAYNNNIIFVKDNGIGIPLDQLETIFKAGERLQLNEAVGVGMGLTFCKKVIEQHNWKIWAESEGEGKGTTFKISIS
ncbi:MAG: PocR ligand-binding domain-containing protein [Leptospiraceae bacterium]|nr:PocR ligand-binding domain-containing protein [Leptospiraceae bacterium]